jgi:hypothetical protein
MHNEKSLRRNGFLDLLHPVVEELDGRVLAGLDSAEHAVGEVQRGQRVQNIVNGLEYILRVETQTYKQRGLTYYVQTIRLTTLVRTFFPLASN